MRKSLKKSNSLTTIIAKCTWRWKTERNQSIFLPIKSRYILINQRISTPLISKQGSWMVFFDLLKWTWTKSSDPRPKQEWQNLIIFARLNWRRQVKWQMRYQAGKAYINKILTLLKKYSDLLYSLPSFFYVTSAKF